MKCPTQKESGEKQDGMEKARYVSILDQSE